MYVHINTLMYEESTIVGASAHLDLSSHYVTCYKCYIADLIGTTRPNQFNQHEQINGKIFQMLQ